MPRKGAPVSLRQQIIDLAATGINQTEIANRVGCNKGTVSRTLKAARAAMPREPAAEPASSDRLRRELLEVALESLRLVRMEQAQGGAARDAMVACGIATQRFLEIHRSLASVDGLPDDLPEDDDDARRAIRRGWWQSATRGGSATAMRQLADAFGVGTADQ
jgi:predicted DNA-binding protein (UPF0251 family)